MIQIFGVAKCKGTKAAQRFFSDRKVPVQFVDLNRKGLSRGELESIARSVGLRALYDPTRDAAVRLVGPTDAQLAKRLVDDASLLRTPIVRDGSRAVLGVEPAAWGALLTPP